MIETHTRILGIAPYDGMRTAMEQAAQAYPNVEMDIYTGDLEDGQAIVQQMPPNSYDCIISRGGTAALIRQVTDLPVVDIHISVYDVLRTMKLAENYSSLYAIVGFPSITEPAHTLCSLLDFNLDILTVNNAAEVRHTLERLQQGGYRMVVCDMVTHTIAREMGFDAFLITSGVESLHAAIDQAVNISSWFGQLRQENLFLRSITQGQNGRVIVMESNGDLFYSSISEVPAELSSVLQSHIREIPASGNLRFYYTDRDQLYSITAQQLLMNNIQRCLFYCVPARIPLHSSRPGLRTLNKPEHASEEGPVAPPKPEPIPRPVERGGVAGEKASKLIPAIVWKHHSVAALPQASRRTSSEEFTAINEAEVRRLQQGGKFGEEAHDGVEIGAGQAMAARRQSSVEMWMFTTAGGHLPTSSCAAVMMQS